MEEGIGYMISENRLSPAECTSMHDIRQEIDELDKQIIALLSQRQDYVHAAVKYKTSPDAVKARERFDSMLQTRRQWAQQQGLSSDMVEKLYRDLVNYFINLEMQQWEKQPPHS
jgi:isochorismate pyruvate lyase